MIVVLVCTHGDVRLMHVSNQLDGRLDVCYDGVWGTVCSRGWNAIDAQVVCRQLGYSTRGMCTLCSLLALKEALNEHAPYKWGVARSFHGDNFNETSGVISPVVALLPFNSHHSSGTEKFCCHSQLFSSGFFMASKLVANSNKLQSLFILFILAGPPPFYTAIQPLRLSH